MRTIPLVVLFASFPLPVQLWADQWTNQAGRVIEARLDAFDGVSVTFTRTNGFILRIPVSALCETDQHRVRLQTGHSLAPSFVQGAYRDAKAILERFERLPAAQRTEETRTATIHMACAVFDARLKPRLAELKDKNVLEEVSFVDLPDRQRGNSVTRIRLARRGNLTAFGRSTAFPIATTAPLRHNSGEPDTPRARIGGLIEGPEGMFYDAASATWPPARPSQTARCRWVRR
jgi:hypothetical protein